MDARADGSSILFFHTALFVNKLTGVTDFGLEAFEFANIAAWNPGNVLLVHSNLGINSLQELFEYTQANPNALRMGIQHGALTYAIASQMVQAGFQLNLVDGGSAAERLMSLLGGHIDVTLSGFGSVADFIEAGTLVPLAMDNGRDFEQGHLKVQGFPSQGFDGVAVPHVYFFAFPLGTDRTLIEVFNREVEDIIRNNPDYAAAIYNAFFQTPTFYGIEEGTAVLDEILETLSSINFGS